MYVKINISSSSSSDNCLLFHIRRDAKCDLKYPKNRNFFSYYGIKHIQPFNRSAEDNDNVPIYANSFGASGKARSIIVVGERGSGKTKLRNYRLSKLRYKSIIVKLYGNSINKYLDNFVSNFKAKNPKSKYANHEIIAKYWTQKDYIQMIISELASIIVKSDTIDKNELHELKENEIFAIASILSYYTIEYHQELLNKINFIIQNLLISSTYCDSNLSKSSCQIDIKNTNNLQEGPHGQVYHDSHNYTQIKELFDKLSISKKSSESVKLLFGIANITGFPRVVELLEKSVNIHLDKLSKFFSKTIKKTPVIVVDSLHENKYFFFEEKVYVDALQAFVNSAIHYDVLFPALGDEEEAAFNTLLFFPLVKDLVVKWGLVDKIPIIKMEWSFEKLRNYTEYLFKFMRKNQIKPCEELPDFEGIVEEPMLLVDLRHPRDLHIFLEKLIDRLNEVVEQRGYSFISEDEDVEIALENAKMEIL